jgi:hypothetical protein
MKLFDTKGGDFVENVDFTILVIESKSKTIVAEISNEVPLLSCPDGLYKRVEIGVNNYNPSYFIEKKFKILFLKDSKDY